MSCGPVPTTFRILDRHGAWELDLAPGSGVALGDAIELALLEPDALDPGELAAVLPPPWIARGCGACEWYLACPTGAVLRYAARIPHEPAAAADPCTPPADPEPGCMGWTQIAGKGCTIELIEPVAIAARRGQIAVLDAGRRELLVLSAGGERAIAAITTAARGPIVFTADAVVFADGAALWRVDLVTLEQSVLAGASGPIERLAFADGGVWAAVRSGDALVLYRLVGGEFRAASFSELLAHARPTGLSAASDEAVCLALPRAGAAPREVCVDRCGRHAVRPLPAPIRKRAAAGTIATIGALDSGIPRCSWHRVRIDLELPESTGVTLALVTSEDAAAQIAAEDWQRVDDLGRLMAAGSGLRECDLLIDQPPGRYLHLRLGLRGDGIVTPRIHRIRIDFPRSTSAAHLPGVFREDKNAADFLERFVAAFDASIEDLDRVITRFPALLDPLGTPAEALSWLGSFLDITLDPAWPEAARRAILAEAPELYRRRGTPWALARAVELTTGIAPAIEELGGTSPFARSGAFRLGESRLFGRARTRFRLGASTTGSAPLHAYGDPDRDHVAAQAFRIRVQVPALRPPGAAERLRRIVDSQKPAHVAASIRVGGQHALLGVSSAVGIDTRLGGLPPPRLGANTRLRATTALARASERGGAALRADSAAVGIQTVLS